MTRYIGLVFIVLLEMFHSETALKAQPAASSGCGVIWRTTALSPIACPPLKRNLSGNQKNGVLPLANLSHPTRVTDAYRVIETRATESARNIVIDGLFADNVLREGVRIKKGGEFDGITIRNFSFVHASQSNVAPDLPEGIHIEAGRNILIENGTVRGFQMTRADDKYWNGDGIAVERDVYDVTIRNVAVIDNTDAGLDIKAKNVLLDNVYAAGNARNIRLWADTRATTLVIGSVVKRGGTSNTAGLWILGRSRPTITIDTLVLDMGADGPPASGIVVEDGPATVTVGRCVVRSMPPGSKLVRAPNPASVVKLGQGCTLPRSGAAE